MQSSVSCVKTFAFLLYRNEEPLINFKQSRGMTFALKKKNPFGCRVENIIMREGVEKGAGKKDLPGVKRGVVA